MTRTPAVAALAATLTTAGCFLPVATGTPEPATTVGAGHFGAAVSGEAPTLDLTAGADDFTDTYADAPAAAGRLGIAYGVAEHTDLEVGLEASLYLFFLPMPIGGSIGVRQGLLAGGRLDLAVAGRIAALRVGADSANAQSDSASAELAQVSIAAQGAFGRFRPLLSVAALGARMTRSVDGVAQDLNGLAGSVTLGAMLRLGSVELGPYVTGTYFTSDAVAGRPLIAGGLALALRPDRHAP